MTTVRGNAMRTLPLVFVLAFVGCASTDRVTDPDAASDASTIRVIRLQHAAVEEIAGVIRARLRVGLSEHRGQADAVPQRPMVIVGHQETNSLIVSTPEERLAEIRALVAELDRR